jgi:hypothetical protein
MKKLLVLTVVLLLTTMSYSQTYATFSPTLFTTPGTPAQKLSATVEVGRQWDALSLGLCFGKLSFAKQSSGDTTLFLEVRPTMTLFQKGKVTNTVTIGFGHIFNAQENFLVEFSTGLNYAISSKVTCGVCIGNYYNSGQFTSSSNQYAGLSVTYTFQ